jgi:hypothetical protein
MMFCAEKLRHLRIHGYNNTDNQREDREDDDQEEQKQIINKKLIKYSES